MIIIIIVISIINTIFMIISITCVLRSAERKVATEARLEINPKSPMAEKRTPSHQNSKAFHA